MKYLLVLFIAGCASSGPYDEQFCVLKTDKGCHAWVIGPGFPK